MSLVIEEADENLFWIELLEKLYPKNMDLVSIKTESLELLKIFSKARGKLGSK